ncbi:MAG: sugar ABC transporter substrate-binding protein [Firmicutes bacterium]|nr:sugar ABC transporter substrate-binding protein [Bacillota bacterium]
MIADKFKVIALLALLVGILFLEGCGKTNTEQQAQGAKQDKEVVTFVNWVSVEEGTRDQIKDVIAAFERENPNIKVDVKPIPVSDIQNQLSIMVAGGNAPDIAQIQADGVITLASMDALEPVDNLLPSDFIQDFHQSLYNAGLFKGKHYSIPWAPTGPGFLYNKKLMQQAGLDPNKPPQTIEELNQDLKLAKEKLPKEVVLLQLDTTIRTVGLMHEWPFMRAFGALPVDGNKVQVNSPEMQAYAEWLRNLFKNGYSLPGKKFGDFRPLAAQNRLLFGVDGPYVVGILKSLNKSLTDKEINDTWGITAIPAGKDGKHYAAPEQHGLVIFKSSKHKAAAAKLAEFLVNSDYALSKYIIPVGYVPATKSAVKRFPQVAQDPIRRAFIEKVFPTVVSMPYGPNYTKIATAIMGGMQEVITTDKPVPEILANVQTKLEGMLSGK